MSKFSEYLSLIPKGLKNPEALIEGWANEIKLQFGTLREDEREEILRRRVICNTCPFNSINAKASPEYKELYGVNYKTNREDLHCAHCSCPVASKTASLTSDCGITSYNAIHQDKQIDLKWKVYKNER